MGYGGYPGMAMPYGAPQYPAGGATRAGAGRTTAAGQTTEQTGTYLGSEGLSPYTYDGPRIIPNPFDNTILIQATPQQYQQILKLLRGIDVPPRQVLIDARIYEVSLTGAFASGVSVFLKQRGAPQARELTGSLVDGFLRLSAGWIVDQSRELLASLQLAENESKAKVISSPSVIATDSIPASINVGVDVPVLTSQSVTPIQSGGNSLFANTIQSRSSGVSLNIRARVNPSGVVTLVINQEVSAPIAPPAGQIQSPSFSRRNVQTQVTLQDGDTIAIGGIINETNASSSAGIPVLHRLPIIGYAFGNKSLSRERTELVIFMTPRVIYDTNEVAEASEEIKSRMRRVSKLFRE